MLSRPFTGVIAAPMLPMLYGGDIDWASLERYIDWIAAQQPAAIVMNVDASEVIALDDDEQMRVIASCRWVIADRVPLLSGVVAGSTRAAAHKAGRLREAGARGLTVFPPFPTFSGAPVPAEMIVRVPIQSKALRPRPALNGPPGGGMTSELHGRARRMHAHGDDDQRSDAQREDRFHDERGAGRTNNKTCPEPTRRRKLLADLASAGVTPSEPMPWVGSPRREGTRWPGVFQPFFRFSFAWQLC